MHFFLSCLCRKYRPARCVGPGRRDIQFNKESQMKMTCWTHGESVQARPSVSRDLPWAQPDLGPPWALTRFVFTYFYSVHVFRLILTQVAWLGIFPSSFTATMNGICVSQLRCTSLNNLNSGRYTD